MKYNLDGAFNRDYVAIGIVGRKSDGHRMDSSSCGVNATLSLQTELFVFREACSIISQR